MSAPLHLNPSTGARDVPLFPLPLVLFPDARLPLHIFEPRYRRLLSDVLASDREFGIVCKVSDAREPEIERGTIGTLTHIDTVAGLPDGRSNILVHGVSRFEVVQLRADAAPYLIAQVAPVVDNDDSAEALRSASRQVLELVSRVGKAARSIADDTSPLPDFPEDARLLSFAIAQAIDLDLSVRQSLLESRSPLDRLRQLEQLLTAVTPSIEDRSVVHERARTNGHGPSASA